MTADRPRETRPSRPARAAMLALLALSTSLLAWEAWRNSPTVDEVAHLPSGISHWQLGRFELYRVNPPLVRAVAALPVLACRPLTSWNAYWDAPHARPEFLIGMQFVRNNGADSFGYFALARWACLPFALIGGWTCFRWASDLYGSEAGLLALTLWVFSPDVLAHAALITPDAPAASLGVLAAYAFWRWLRAPDWRRAALAGLACGLAQLSKSTWILLYALWPALWAAWGLAGRPPATDSPKAGAGQLASILLLAIYATNVAYGFEGSFKPLGEYRFVSGTLTRPDPAGGPPVNRFKGSPLASLRVPFPENYVRGIDVQRWDLERGKWSYLGGVQKRGGWWYYYLYGTSIKVPIGTWAIGAIALALTLRDPGQFARGRDEVVLLAPAAVVFTLVSSQLGFNRNMRYVLPCQPFLFVWVAKAAITARSGRRITAALTAGFLALSIGSSLAVYPHSLSYFNEIVGGPMGGPAHLLDSNIDWGQDLLNLRRWIEAHPEASDIRVQYFGYVNPEVAGIRARRPPPGRLSGEAANAPRDGWGPQPGWFAVSVNYLHGYRHAEDDEPRFTYFLRYTPVDTVGYSIYIYHVTSEECDRVRRELGLPPLGGAARALPADSRRGVSSGAAIPAPGAGLAAPAMPPSSGRSPPASSSGAAGGRAANIERLRSGVSGRVAPAIERWPQPPPPTRRRGGFNGATALQPWKTPARLSRRSAMDCFNGATALQPWKTRN